MANTPVFTAGAETKDLSEATSTAVGAGGAISVDSGTVHGTGVRSWKINVGTGITYLKFGGLGSAFASLIAANVIGVRFYLNPSSLPAANGANNLFALTYNSNGDNLLLGLSLTSTGALALYNSAGTLLGTSSITLSTGTQYRIGLLWNKGASGSYELDVNGAAALTGTSNLGANQPDTLWLGRYTGTGSTFTVYVDDMTVDTAGIPPDTSGVILFQPAATGHYTAGTDTGATSPTDVLWPSNGDADYWNDSTTNDVRTWTLTTTSLIGGGTVNCAMVGAYMKYGTSAMNSKLRCRSGSTDSDSAAFALTSSYAYYSKVYATDPSTSAAWTQSGLNAAEVGVNNVGTSLLVVRCTAIGMMVDYWAGASGPTVNSVSGQAGSGAAGTTLNLVFTAPTGIVSGDTLVAVLAFKSSPAASPNWSAVPSGWSQVAAGTSQFNGLYCSLAVYAKTATNSEPATYTFSMFCTPGDGGAVGFILDVTGSNGLIETAAFNSGGTNTSPVLPSVTTLGANRLLLGGMSAAAGGTLTQPSGWTDQTATGSHSGAPTLEVSSLAQAAAGASGTATGTAATSTNWGCFNLAIAATGASVTVQPHPPFLWAYLEPHPCQFFE